MQPVTVSVTTTRPREEVFDYLNHFPNRAEYLDHMFTKWIFSGPANGVGAKGSARVNAPGSNEHAEFELVESERPERTVEESVSAKYKRKTRGTYRLSEDPGGGTAIEFELAWIDVPRSERMLPPLSRAFQRRALGKGMRQLAKRLDDA